MTDTELAWAAGFIDGDGCFGVKRRQGDKGTFRLSVAQSNPEPLHRLALIFGNNVNGPYEHRTDPLRKKPTYQWGLTGQRAVDAAKLLWPYLCKPRKVQIKSTADRLTGQCRSDIMELSL